MKDLTPHTNNQPTARIGTPSRLAAGPSLASHRGKPRKVATGPIKRIITAAAVATTLGGGALFAQHDAVRAAQVADAESSEIALIAAATTPMSMLEATATPPLLATATASLTQVPLTLAQATATLQLPVTAPATDIAATATGVPATATVVPATATSVPATATVAKATATAAPVAKAVARTKSSR